MKFVAFGLVAAMGLASAAKFDDELNLVDFATMDLVSAFADFQTAFERQYEDISEEYQRFGHFVSNLQMIAQHNSDASHSYKMRTNQFGDMSRDEYVAYVRRGYNGRPNNVISLLSQRRGRTDEDGVDANPASVDWSTQGVVTPVKNQGQCGSCWSFSATGATECRVAIATGTLNSLSEQQLVDCSRREGNLGCNGGQMDAAFKYIESTGGLCTEREYPYKAKDGTCESSSCGTFYDPISGYTDVRQDNEADLETAAAAGCVSVAIEADQASFQFYSSGVLDGNCGTNLDHGVLVVGYGTMGTEKYWKVKNSWGTSWGMNGYVNICKECDKNGSRGECGIAMDPSFPISKN